MSRVIRSFYGVQFEVDRVARDPGDEYAAAYFRVVADDDPSGVSWGLYWRPSSGGEATHLEDYDTCEAAVAVAEKLADDPYSLCVRCEDCLDAWCTIHALHWFDCTCPGFHEEEE